MIKASLIIGFMGVLVFVIWLILQKLRRKLDWAVEHKKIAQFIFEGDNFEIKNYRNFNWQKNNKILTKSEREEKYLNSDEFVNYDIRYENRMYKLSDITAVKVIISYYGSNFKGAAHIFLSFATQNGENIVISIEARRKVGEEFSPWLGLLRQFEVIYVVGSEQDVINLRTKIRKEKVYVYPTIASPEKARQLFLLLAKDTNTVFKKSKMYNTISHNCVNEITKRVEEISTLNFSLTWKSIFPGFFDEILYEMKIIPTDKPFEDIKTRYKIEDTTII